MPKKIARTRITIEKAERVVELHRLGGLSHQKIADEVGIAKFSAQKIIQDPETAIEKIKQRIARKKGPVTSILSPYLVAGGIGVCRQCFYRVPLPCVYCAAKDAREQGVPAEPENESRPMPNDPTPDEISAFYAKDRTND